jgi:hypothetical protein
MAEFAPSIHRPDDLKETVELISKKYRLLQGDFVSAAEAFSGYGDYVFVRR